MRVSVLTPSFNQARFLAANLASVRAQGEVVLEHIVVDGASSDGSRELLERSGVRFVSEPDRGQGDALNKALAMARGEVIGWLNSDDAYLPGAVARAQAAIDQLDMVYGHADQIDADGNVIGRVDAYDVDLEGLLAYATIPQPSCFVRRAALESVGGVDIGFRYAMDYDLWLRLGLAGARWRAVDETWAQFRIHGASKTVSESAHFLPEVERAQDHALASPRLPPRLAARRPSLRRRFHTNVARAAYANLDLPTARAHAAMALIAQPLGLNPALVSVGLKSLLPERAVRAWRGLRR